MHVSAILGALGRLFPFLLSSKDMAPYSHTRSKRGKSLRRSTTHFPALETHPASPQSIPQPQTTSSHSRETTQISHLGADPFGDDIFDDDLSLLKHSASVKTDRGQSGKSPSGKCHSSPQIKQAPASTWNFNIADSDNDDEPIPVELTQINSRLPDTVPLPATEERDIDLSGEKHSRVDLSETASTGWRSPSVRSHAATDIKWDFGNIQSTPGNSTHQKNTPSRGSRDNARLEQIQSSRSVTEQRVAPFKDTREPLDDELPSLGNTEVDAALFNTSARVHNLDCAPPRMDLESEKDFVASPPETSTAEHPITLGNGVSKTVVGNGQLSEQASEISPYDIGPESPVPKLIKPGAKLTEMPVVSSSNGSGRKRKQIAREPINLNSPTFVVGEDPPSEKRSHTAHRATAKAMEEPLPGLNYEGPVAAKPTTPAPVSKEKRPRPAIPHMEETAITIPKKHQTRAAARKARAATKRQLSSSSSPNSEDDEQLDFHHNHIVHPINDPAGERSAATSTPMNNARESPGELHGSPSAREDGKDNPQTPNGVMKPAKMLHKTAQSDIEHSTQGFGGASGGMYTAAPSQPKTCMIKDSQNDSQDQMQAHLAEEKHARTTIMIPSDTSSDPSEIGDLPHPPLVLTQISQQSDPSPSQFRVTKLDPVPKLALANDGLVLAGPVCKETPHSEVVEVPNQMPKERKPAKVDVKYVSQRKVVESTTNVEAKIYKGLALNSRVPSDITLVPIQSHGKLQEAVLPDVKDKSESSDNNTIQRHLGKDPHPDEASISRKKRQHGAQARIRTRGKSISVSRAGSPRRLAGEGQEHPATDNCLDSPSLTAVESKDQLYSGIRHGLGQDAGHRLSWGRPVVQRVGQSAYAACAPCHKSNEETTLFDSGRGEPGSGRLVSGRSRSHTANVKDKIYSQISATRPEGDSPASETAEVPKTPSSLQKHQADIAVHLHGVVDVSYTVYPVKLGDADLSRAYYPALDAIRKGYWKCRWFLSTRHWRLY